MRLIFSILLLGLMACTNNAPKDCAAQLRKRDDRIDAKTDSMLYHKDELPPEVYKAAIETLRQEELELFEAVRDCDFENDLSSYNYWYRSRLKVPSRLQVELQQMVKPERDPRLPPIRTQ
ncbi:MAG: hypothetical protein J0L99_09055 [Chitinophagales bacterium]|nr:hypothetical protein [Chitinophagales bacterium]